MNAGRGEVRNFFEKKISGGTVYPGPNRKCAPISN